MKRFKTSIVIMLGIILVALCFVGCAEEDTWLDHLSKDDPFLAGVIVEEPITWIGEWTLVSGWYQNESGEVEEEEEYEGYVIYNEDGTCEFKCFDDVFTGTYEFVIKCSLSVEDEWWNGPWYVTLEGDSMTWFTGADPNGEGDGYKFVAEEVTDLWIGEWTLVSGWYQNESGEVEEEEEHEGYVIYNEDGTCEFKCFDDVFTGTYEFVIKCSLSVEDEWWNGPWYVTLGREGMTWFNGADPDGEGDGYEFERPED